LKIAVWLYSIIAKVIIDNEVSCFYETRCADFLNDAFVHSQWVRRFY